MMWPTPCLHTILAMMSSQRPHGVCGVGQAAATKVDLRVRLHLHEGEHLLVARLVDKAGAQQVVDAQELAGRGALRVRTAARKLRAQLLVVQNQSVAVVGHLQLVARLHVGGGGEVAADPGGQTHAGVRPPRAAGLSSECPGRCPASRDRCSGRSATLILKTPSRAEPCRCTVSPTSNSKSESVPAHALSRVNPDRGHDLFLPTEEPSSWARQARDRRGRVSRVCRGLWGPRRLGGVIDPACRAATVDVPTLALTQGAASQRLAEDRPQHGSHRLLHWARLSETASRSERGTSRPASLAGKCRESCKAPRPPPHTSPPGPPSARELSAPPAGCPFLTDCAGATP